MSLRACVCVLVSGEHCDIGDCAMSSSAPQNLLIVCHCTWSATSCQRILVRRAASASSSRSSLHAVIYIRQRV